MLKTKAIVKNIAPPKQGVKNGLAELTVQPAVQALLPNQLESSIPKFAQANNVPQSRTMNCAVIIFFIFLNFFYLIILKAWRILKIPP
jgi:hypothetical protein